MAERLVKINGGLFDGALVIDIQGLVQAMSDEEKKTLAQHLAFDRELYEGAIDHLINGCAYDGNWWFGGETEQKWREKIVGAMPKIAQDAIRHLHKENALLRQRKDYYERLHYWYERLERRRKDSDWEEPMEPRPEDPGFATDPQSPEELVAALNALANEPAQAVAREVVK